MACKLLEIKARNKETYKPSLNISPDTEPNCKWHLDVERPGKKTSKLFKISQVFSCMIKSIANLRFEICLYTQNLAPRKNPICF